MNQNNPSNVVANEVVPTVKADKKAAALTAKLAKKQIKADKKALRSAEKANLVAKQKSNNASTDKPAKVRRAQKRAEAVRRLNEQLYGSTEYQVALLAKEQRFTDFKWHKLDNSALIYPAVGYENNSVFRLSVNVNFEVEPLVLQRAVNEIVPRFPTITSTLRTGIFWYYLDSPVYPLVVREEKDLPCRPFKMDHKHPLVRVLYRKHSIITEFFHAATDGSGGLPFLNCLVATYLRLKGETITDRTNCPHSKDLPRYEETVDSTQLASNNERHSVKHVKALHLKGERLPKGAVVTRKAVCDTPTLLLTAKKYGCTVTQYLSACLLRACRKHADVTLNKDTKPIRISTPTNLRKIFNSSSYRNFSSYYYTTYVEGTFEELVASVRAESIQTVTKEYFQSMLNYNTGAQKNIFMRLAPLFLKNIVLHFVMKAYGYNLNTYTLSNLGVVSCPKDFEKYVTRYEFSLGEVFGASVCSYNGLTTISLTGFLKDSLAERFFVEQLTADGVTVCVESVYGGSL